jgi:hypothetical protein
MKDVTCAEMQVFTFTFSQALPASLNFGINESHAHLVQFRHDSNFFCDCNSFLLSKALQS